VPLKFRSGPDAVFTQRGFPDAGDFFLNYTLKYDMALPDKQRLRVCPVTNPICPTKANLNRDIGDTVQIDIGPAIGLAKGVILSGLYRYVYIMQLPAACCGELHYAMPLYRRWHAPVCGWKTRRWRSRNIQPLD
jgi:hypothetical protein